jgi:hypothetical protein
MDEEILRRYEEALRTTEWMHAVNVRRLTAEVRRLHDALLKYGQRLEGCVFFQDDDSDVGAYGPNGLCTCGLDEARVQQPQPG